MPRGLRTSRPPRTSSRRKVRWKSQRQRTCRRRRARVREGEASMVGVSVMV